MFENWTYACYLRSVTKLLEDHSQVSFLGDFPDKYIILRHDVDYDLDAALRLAVLENKYDIHATYFLLLTADMYNVMNSTIITDLWTLGHRVGLHYDIAKDSDVFRQSEILSIKGGGYISEIAAHNPSVNGKDKFRSGKWLNSAYADKFTKETTYISDSCSKWKWDWTVIPDKIQLNTHPINWSDTETERYQKLENVRQRKLKEINDYMDYCKGLWLDHDKRSL